MDGPYSRREIVDVLRRAGCRITAQRTAVIDYLAGRSDHPTARQIYSAVKLELPGVSMATVYNTLRTLVAAGAITEIAFDDGGNRFDTSVHPHLNLVCTVCGCIADHRAELSVSPEAVQQSMGFVTSGVQLEFRGRCAECAGTVPAANQSREG